MVLQPNPASVNSHRGKSPATEEYPSPPPSNHGSPQNSRPILEEEEESLFHTVGSFGSTGASSLPTTPALIDSFPTIPFSSLHIGNRDLQPPSPLGALASEALPVRSSSHGAANARQRAGSTPDAWAFPVPQRHNSDLDQAWDLTEQDETDYTYPLHPRGGLPLPGPPPSAPLPPEPASPRFQTSAIHKHFHQLELDFSSLTRKLTSTSSTSGGSTYPSTPDSSRVLKKSASHSLLRREHSGMSASSGASSSHGMVSSPSTSAAAILPSTSPQRSDGVGSPYSTRHNSTQLSQSFSPVVSNRQRSTTESSVIAPLKLKQKPSRESSRAREEKERDKDGHQKRRFFSKYASAGSQVEKEAAALLASIADQEDVYSIKGGHNEVDSRGFADEEWSAHLGGVSSPNGKAKEGSTSLITASPSSQQRSPIDEASSVLSASWTANRSGVSPSEYVVQHILPPAELLRLERIGFTTGDGVNTRGREDKLGSPLSAFGNPFSAVLPSASPLNTGMEWSRKSTSTSRVDTVPPIPSEPKTRSQRSGSLATASPISPSSTRPSSSRHNLHGNSNAAKSANALPLGAESRGSRPSSSGNGAIVQPPVKPGMIRPATTPSSPAGGFAPLSLPPPPRSRVRSMRSNNGEGQSPGEGSRGSRRSSNASNALTMSAGLQKHHSIMRKPSFIDMADDDGRPSLEDASPAAAPGINLDEDGGSYFSHHGSRTPSTRSRSTTINGWQPENSSGNSSTSSLRGQTTTYSNTRTDDSFLDMGKVSLDTIRSADEEDINMQPPPKSQYTHAPVANLGSPYGSTYY